MGGALLGTFPSEALGTEVRLAVWRPARGGGGKLVVLLHGADSGPDEVAARLGDRIAEAVEETGLIVACPDGGAASWYLGATGRMVAEDLRRFAVARLGLDAERGVIGLSGISMGGHGALTLALRGARFHSASALSGVVDLTRAADRPALVGQLGAITAHRAAWEAASARHLIDADPARALRLALRLSVGASDRWAPDNVALHERLAELGVPHEFALVDGGHDWDVWARLVGDDLRFHARAAGV